MASSLTTIDSRLGHSENIFQQVIQFDNIWKNPLTYTVIFHEVLKAHIHSRKNSTDGKVFENVIVKS
jgi:hypothetical protein